MSVTSAAVSRKLSTDHWFIVAVTVADDNLDYGLNLPPNQVSDPNQAGGRLDGISYRKCLRALRYQSNSSLFCDRMTSSSSEESDGRGGSTFLFSHTGGGTVVQPSV